MSIEYINKIKKDSEIDYLKLILTSILLMATLSIRIV